MKVLTINNKKPQAKQLLKMLGFLLVLILIYLPFLISDYENDINNNISNEIDENLKISGISEKIYINNNWSDAKAAGICTGSGTYSDPYVIQDLIIDGHGSGSGIKITLSRNYFFRIENCTIFNCSYGIELFSTDNGTLYQNDCSFNGIGIYLHCPNPFTFETYGCFNNTITENTANNNSMYGIHLDWFTTGDIINNTANNNVRGIYHGGYPTIISGNTANNNQIGISVWGPGSNSEISRNIAIDNKDYGIEIQSISVNLTKNFMVGSGIAVSSYSQISIDTTNIVNGGPIYFYVNETNLTPNDFTNAGQIILGNCTNILIKNINVSKSSMGISIYNSNNITVLNAVSSNNDYGVYLQNTNNSFIINSTLIYNKYGNFIGGSNNTVEGNYIYSNLMTMEALTFNFWDDYNKIINNEIFGSQKGIVFRLSSYNLIYGNIIRDNYYGIIVMGGSEHNLFYENFFIGNNVVHTNGGSTTNKWNNTEIGNYWDNYTGIDRNNDGIGDTPHNITHSPLMQDFLPIVDNKAPDITIISPKNNSFYNLDAPNFNVIIKERFLYNMWYTLDGGLQNYTFIENRTINQGAWNASPEGNVTIRFYANDSLGNIGFAEVTIRKDVTAPTIIINNPQNNDVIGATAPSFDISINESNLDTVWYSLNGGTNITFTGVTGTINQALWDALPEGNVFIKFYANDKLGRIGFQEIIVNKVIPQPIPPEIPGYDLLFFVGIISVMVVVIIKKKVNL